MHALENLVLGGKSSFLFVDSNNSNPSSAQFLVLRSFVLGYDLIILAETLGSSVYVVALSFDGAWYCLSPRMPPFSHAR